MAEISEKTHAMATGKPQSPQAISHTEENYWTTEKECFAVVRALIKFVQPLIQGSQRSPLAHETAEMTPLSLIHGREVTTTLDAMLPHEGDANHTGAEEFTQRAEEARQFARARVCHQQHKDAKRYDVGHKFVTYTPGDKVWV